MRRILVFLLLVAILVAGVFEWESAHFAAPGPRARQGDQTVVLIPSGVGLQGVSEILAYDGVIERPELFQLGVRFRRQTARLKAGEYAIPSRASMADIVGILSTGKSIQHKITAAEGLTSDMIYKLVVADPVLVGDAGPEPAEGTLLPETYLFTRGTTRGEIVARMKAAQEKLLDRLWAMRARNAPVKTKAEAVVLASIVEKETGIAEERRHVAAVFANRLKLGMKLQSDPTIIYGITKGYPLGRRIKQSEIDRVTPYNTYAIAGLPAAPICNPGKDSIAAVLDPGTTKDLFFVANGTGGHSFSASAAEQAANVAKWRQIELQQIRQQTK